MLNGIQRHYTYMCSIEVVRELKQPVLMFLNEHMFHSGTM